MINIKLDLLKDGSFVECEAKGHALFASGGFDIVCAAVTSILRTTAAVLASYEGVSLFVDAPCRGDLVFRVVEACSCNKEKLIFAADFLQKGLAMIASEYPANVRVQVNVL